VLGARLGSDYPHGFGISVDKLPPIIEDDANARRELILQVGHGGYHVKPSDAVAHQHLSCLNPDR